MACRINETVIPPGRPTVPCDCEGKPALPTSSPPAPTCSGRYRRPNVQAKVFGAEKGHRYVNGVLDKLARQVRRDELCERSPA